MSVLAYLAHRWSYSEGKAWPSMDRIATDVGIARSTVQKALATLIKAQVITSTQPKGRRANGGLYANEYRLQFDAKPCTDSANHVPRDCIRHVPPHGNEHVPPHGNQQGIQQQQGISKQGIDLQHSAVNTAGLDSPFGESALSWKSQIFKISEQVKANRGQVAKLIAECGKDEAEAVMLELLEDALEYGVESIDPDYVLGAYLEHGR